MNILDLCPDILGMVENQVATIRDKEWYETRGCGSKDIWENKAKVSASVLAGNPENWMMRDWDTDEEMDFFEIEDYEDDRGVRELWQYIRGRVEDGKECLKPSEVKSDSKDWELYDIGMDDYYWEDLREDAEIGIGKGWGLLYFTKYER